MDLAQKKRLELEYRQMKADPNVMHGTLLHERILANWKAHSSSMWAGLQKAGPDGA